MSALQVWVGKYGSEICRICADGRSYGRRSHDYRNNCHQRSDHHWQAEFGRGFRRSERSGPIRRDHERTSVAAPISTFTADAECAATNPLTILSVDATAVAAAIRFDRLPKVETADGGEETGGPR